MLLASRSSPEWTAMTIRVSFLALLIVARHGRRRRSAGPHRSSLVSRRTGLLDLRAPVRHAGRTVSARHRQTPKTDEDKALASWLWRNTHYFHGEEGAEDLWGQGFTKGGDLRTREYWTGLFAHGFGLCGTTHSQWVAEMDALLGHGRGRGVGVDGHNSFEVFLTGGAYGDGKWALLDHDLSTVIFDADGHALLSIARDRRRTGSGSPTASSSRTKQHGWLVCGLHPDDGGVYRSATTSPSTSPATRPAADGPPAPRRDAAPLPRSRAWRTARRSSSGAATTTPAASPARSGSHDLGQPAGEDVRLARRRRLQARAGALRQRRLHLQAGLRRPATTAKASSRRTTGTSIFEFYTPYIIAATPAERQAVGHLRAGLPQRPGAARQGRLCNVSALDRSGRDLAGLRHVRRRPGPDRPRQGPPAVLAALRTPGRSSWQKSGPDDHDRLPGEPVAHAAAEGRRQRGAVSRRPGGRSCRRGRTCRRPQAHVVAGKFGTPAVTLELATPRGEPVAGGPRRGPRRTRAIRRGRT